eukprot:sb/3471700/
MEKFIKLRESNATSKKRVEYESMYEDMMVNERFSNAWKDAKEDATYDNYDDFVYEEEEDAEDDEYEDIVFFQSSSTAPMSLPPLPEPEEDIPGQPQPSSLPLPLPPDTSDLPVYSTVKKELPTSLNSTKQGSLPRNTLASRLEFVRLVSNIVHISQTLRQVRIIRVLMICNSIETCVNV